MPKSKFYAVRVGRKPGIYLTWAECQAQINHFSGAQYKSFASRSEADAYLTGQSVPRSATKKLPTKVSTATTMPAADIIVYTDGGNRNTGNVQGGQVKPTDKSAWAFQITMGGRTITGTSGEWGATNNRMEIMALLQALSYLLTAKQATSNILVIMDSKYVLDAIQKGWLHGWKRRGWRRAGNQPLANSERWRLIDTALRQFTNLAFKWVKGHATTAGNNLVDQLLNQTMDQMTKGQPIPVQNATANLPGRPATTVQGDLVATTTPQPKQPHQTATQPHIAPAKSAPVADKFGHLTSDQAQAKSVEAMTEIAKNWQQDDQK